MIEIPVYLVGAAGTPDADNPHCSPCIICTLLNERALTPLSGPILGMLDSGAYPNAMDEAVWRRMRLPELRRETVHSVSGVQETIVCEATIQIQAGQTIISKPAHFLVMPQRSNGHPYDLVLGRTFLTQFEFGFSTARNAWHFSLPANG